MSIAALGWGIAQTTGSGTRKAVLIALCNYADEDGKSWPSIRRICRDTEFSERTVREALRELEAAGFVTKDERRTEDGAMRSNLYTLRLSDRGQISLPRGHMAPPREREPQGTLALAQGDSGRGAGGTPGVAPPEPSLRTKKERKIPPLPSEETPNGVSVKRGSALPDDWTPQETHYGKASAESLDAEWVNDQADAFRDWALANRNRPVARKADWDRTFHSWLRREIPRAALHGRRLNGKTFDPEKFALQNERQRLAEKGLLN